MFRGSKDRPGPAEVVAGRRHHSRPRGRHAPRRRCPGAHGRPRPRLPGEESIAIAVGETLLEVPAGTIDEGETPDQTAERELAEETGFRAGRITPIRDWFVSPGVMTERMFLYLCEDLQPGPTDHQPDERLEPVIVPWTEALAMAHDGRIQDAKSMLGLLICDRLRNRAQVADPAGVVDRSLCFTSPLHSQERSRCSDDTIHAGDHDRSRGWPCGMLAAGLTRLQVNKILDKAIKALGGAGKARQGSGLHLEGQGKAHDRGQRKRRSRPKRPFRGLTTTVRYSRASSTATSSRARSILERRQGLAEVRRPDHGDGPRRRQERETQCLPHGRSSNDRAAEDRRTSRSRPPPTRRSTASRPRA